MSFRMQFYSSSELALIIKKAAVKLNQDIKEESADEIAKRSRGTPRIALRLLKRVRDFALVKNSSLMDLNITLHALNELGVNELGFDEADLAYLSLLANAQGKPVGLNTIAASMREDEGTIEDVIEPFLFYSLMVI